MKPPLRLNNYFFQVKAWYVDVMDGIYVCVCVTGGGGR